MCDAPQQSGGRVCSQAVADIVLAARAAQHRLYTTLCLNVESRAYTPLVQGRMCDDNRQRTRHAADSHAIAWFASHRPKISWNGRTPLGCHQIITPATRYSDNRSDWPYHLGGTYPVLARLCSHPLVRGCRRTSRLSCYPAGRRA